MALWQDGYCLRSRSARSSQNCFSVSYDICNAHVVRGKNQLCLINNFFLFFVAAVVIELVIKYKTLPVPCCQFSDILDFYSGHLYTAARQEHAHTKNERKYDMFFHRTS